MPLVHHERGEAALPEVSPPLLAAIHFAGVALVRLADGPPQGIGGARDGDEVDMIGHRQ